MFGLDRRIDAVSGERSHVVAPRVAIVYPGAGNSSYNDYARRIGIALGRLGIPALCCELWEIPDGSLDLCILSGLGEIVHVNGRAAAARSLGALRERARVLLSLSVSSVASSWFDHNLAASVDLGADAILDVGILPQSDGRFRKKRINYRHIFDGLLATEADMIEDSPAPSESDRPIPWAQVGIKNADRIGLADLLVTGFDSGGLVYLPDPPGLTEHGYSRLNASQLEHVLVRTKYYIWLQKSGTLYYESLRYRTSIQTGCVPINVVGDSLVVSDDAPFADTLIRESDLIATLRSSQFGQRAEKFRADYLLHPRLEDELSRLLEDLGHHGWSQPARASRKRLLASSSASVEPQKLPGLRGNGDWLRGLPRCLSPFPATVEPPRGHCGPTCCPCPACGTGPVRSANTES